MIVVTRKLLFHACFVRGWKIINWIVIKNTSSIVSLELNLPSKLITFRVFLYFDEMMTLVEQTMYIKLNEWILFARKLKFNSNTSISCMLR